ncbi:MAG: class I SAM-dependent methyltransferase [Patescibacteria group bacterium]
MMGLIDHCRVCNSPNLKPFFDLGSQPLANSLPAGPDEKENYYPLSLSWCADCNLVQLDYTVDPKILFDEYVWVTGTSGVAQKYSQTFADELIARVPKEDGYVLEVASNDGTFLFPFIEKGYKVLGVDPAKNIAEMAEKAGAPTLCAFWSEAEAEKLVSERGKAKAIFARNVLPHVANTVDFVKGLARALSDDGTLAIEAHYAKIILEGLHYDSIYHEHLCYFTLKSLEKLLNDSGLFVFDIMTSPISGGSMVVYAKKSRGEESALLKSYRDNEEKIGLNSFASWQGFAARSISHRDKLNEMLDEAKKSDPNGLVVGYGASARSSTLLNFCGINRSRLPVIADKNPLKQGRYTAGSRIPIEKPEAVMARKPTHVFILAWNFEEEIRNYLEKDFGFKGTYIVPLPNDPRIIKT